MDTHRAAPLAHYPRSRLPESDWLWSQAAMREELRQAAPDGEALRARARGLVELHVYKRMGYRGSGEAFVAGLLRQGHSREAVAQALADAWLQGSDTFALPQASRWAWAHTLWAQLALSLLITIAPLVVALKVMARTHPQVNAYLLAFPPLLAIVAFAVMFPVFQVVKRLLGGWTVPAVNPGPTESPSP